jgi:hypothetical protein
LQLLFETFERVQKFKTKKRQNDTSTETRTPMKKKLKSFSEVVGMDSFLPFPLELYYRQSLYLQNKTNGRQTER